MQINFEDIEKIFAQAEKDNRNLLFEHEVYQILKQASIQTPNHLFVRKGENVSKKDLEEIGSNFCVLKIVSPLIVHKTDVGGVQFVKADVDSLNDACQRMLEDVPRKFLNWIKQFRSFRGKKEISLEGIEKDIRGVLVCEKVEYEQAGFGAELLLGLRNSREFGPVVTMGTGGVDTEYLSERLKESKALVASSCHLLQKKDILPRLKTLAVYDKLVVPFRGKEAVTTKQELVEAYFRFLEVGAHFSPSRASSYVIEEAECNPMVFRKKRLIPLDGMCRFSRHHPDVNARPVENLSYLLHPQTIAIIGVSEKMNLGHIILDNILRQGFSQKNVFIVKPGAREIEGCACVPGISALPKTVDLFVLTLAAEQSLEVMEELIGQEKARSVIIIAGAIGEKKGTQALEEKIKALIEKSRKEGKMTPVVNGGNSLGIYSMPGKYDTTFIPEHKLMRPEGGKANLAYISQSGAFMISRMSKLPLLKPRYAVSVGNQIDLTASDFLGYLQDDDEANIFALYIEGFRQGDGLDLAKAARRITKQEGKMIVIYKAGRTPEGKEATSSHTASVAGDYAVCRQILEDSGVFVAEDIFEFENAIKSLSFLASKIVRGKRIAMMSNAGFECVIMADNLKNSQELKLARFSQRTTDRIAALFKTLGIDRIQDVRNPLDVTPVADDAVFAECAKVMLEDENVDCAVISPLPMSPVLQTLAPGKFHKENIHNSRSIGIRLIDIFRKTDKPFVVSIDAGDIYQPLVNLLEQAGIPVFRRCDEATKFLRKYINTFLCRKK